MPQVLDDPHERTRLKQHDAKLLVTRRTEIGDEVAKETYNINTDREQERLLEVVERMAVIASDDPDERLEKAVALETAADEIFGSRDSYYVARIRTAAGFPGKINPELTNGAIVFVDSGLIIKTEADVDFEAVAHTMGETTTKRVDTATDRHLRAFNDGLAILERRKPAVKQITQAVRQETHDRLAPSVGARIKALAPPKNPKK